MATTDAPAQFLAWLVEKRDFKETSATTMASVIRRPLRAGMFANPYMRSVWVDGRGPGVSNLGTRNRAMVLWLEFCKERKHPPHEYLAQVGGILMDDDLDLMLEQRRVEERQQES